ncbi:hypothetical protein N656DRAFT_769623 [Canariomyces notabilis]|uniref:Uncharacterized protein n=1 Tax=Canariomyces notabilis TaxID=2074819 RepID=A0AAN6YPT9_9PEZI|nr:hypothetical protein N656DRAFT_769623 [Canariomyces arenarius]
MKFSILSLLSVLASAALAAPTDAASDVAGQIVNDGVIRLNVTDLHPPSSLTRRQNGNPNTEATLQAWRFDGNCQPGPGFNFLWFPVGWTAANNPSGACHEFFENGIRRDVLSVMVTGTWGGNCRLRMYENTGCTGGVTLRSPGQCGNRAGNPIRSFNVVC